MFWIAYEVRASSGAVLTGPFHLIEEAERAARRFTCDGQAPVTIELVEL